MYDAEIRMALDIENNLNGEDLGQVESNDPLLPRSDRSSNRSSRRNRRSLEVIVLDDIPPIIKSANGNIFWADEQCTRRVGLTATEARLFLKLLQPDEPGNFEYSDYKQMFDDFKKEQMQMVTLVAKLPWYKPNTYRQRAIWKARIRWLQRMEEPRAWLLYLMARRRRILAQASKRVLIALKEKHKHRVENDGMEPREVTERGRPPPSRGSRNGQDDQELPGHLHMLNDATQTSTPMDTSPQPPAIRPKQIPMENEQVQTSETLLSDIRLSHLTSRLRDSLSASRRRHSRHSSQSRCVFPMKRLQATREDIKRQMELIMPPSKPYIVIGWFHRAAGNPNERLLQFEKPEDFFIALRQGEYQVRGYREILSLKGLRGFGLYKCDIARGAHIPLTLNSSQEAVLAQMFYAYRASNHHADTDVALAWHGWIYKNLNNCNNNPLEGRYSLQLIYDWSSYRLSFIVAIPVILSLAIGTWYMMGHGDVVTSWTLALYIVTTAAALIALMAIIGSLKDL